MQDRSCRIRTMNRMVFKILMLLLAACSLPVISGCSFAPALPPGYKESKASIIDKYVRRVPKQWAENVPGVKTKLVTDDNVLALTLDACGSKTDSYDAKLINYLIKENVQATLFINARWIDKFPDIFDKLAVNPLFEIENHGLMHRPCSVNGKSIYGIKGTENVGQVFDEIEKNALKIESLTGRKPKFYRSGTAYYDEVSAEIVNELGYEIAGFSVLGDAGASYPAEKVKEALLKSQPGDIIICHMNHPEKETAEGIIAAVPELKSRGFSFVKLQDYKLK